MMRIWPRKPGGESTRGTSGTRGGGTTTAGPGGWAPPPQASERQSRYCKSGSLDSRYGSRTGLGPHMMGLHLGPNPWHDVQPAHQQSKLTINPKGNIIEIKISV